jgi:hypothetical protein
MPPFLSDEPVQAYEDAADRRERREPRTVERELQVAAKHSWEDARRRTIEKHGLAILERVNFPGVQRLDKDDFGKLCSFVYWEQERERKHALRVGKIDLGRTVVLRSEGGEPKTEAA